MSSDNSNRLRFDLAGLLFIVFLTLKLCGVIDWSWWWVTAPLWAPLAIAALVFTFVYIVFE